jgi:hypothetical protein
VAPQPQPNPGEAAGFWMDCAAEAPRPEKVLVGAGAPWTSWAVAAAHPFPKAGAVAVAHRQTTERVAAVARQVPKVWVAAVPWRAAAEAAQLLTS